MESSTHVTRTVGNLTAGGTHDFTVLRNGEVITLNVTIEALPENVGELPTDQNNTPEPESEDDNSSAKLLGMNVSPMAQADRRRLGLDAGTPGLVINSVESRGPASELGLSAGQAILEVNFQPVSTTAEFEALVEEARENGRESILVSIRLNRQTSVVPLNIEED